MNNGLRIAFFGSSLLSAYWNGAATYYRGIIRELHKRGHVIQFFEPAIYERQEHVDIVDPDYAQCIVYDANMSDLLKCIQMAKESDVIIKTSGIGVFDADLEKLVLDIRTKNNKVIFWDVDAPATLDRVKIDPKDPFRSLIPEFDFIITYGGGDPVVNSYKQLGARQCIPIYNALDPSTHFPVSSAKKFEATLGFMGNRLPDREKRVSDYFFSAASHLPEKTFLLGGNGWDNFIPNLKNIRRVGHVFTNEHNAFYCSTLVTLNINRQSMAEYGFSPPTRIFEAAGAGACIICDQWKGVEQFLALGKECIVVGSGKEVAEVVKSLSPDEAKKIGNAARERVLSEHTYYHRVNELETFLQTNPKIYS